MSVTLTHRHVESVERCGGDGELGVCVVVDWSLTVCNTGLYRVQVLQASRNVPMALVMLVLWLVQDMCNRRIPVGRAAAGWERLQW